MARDIPLQHLQMEEKGEWLIICIGIGDIFKYRILEWNLLRHDLLLGTSSGLVWGLALLSMEGDGENLELHRRKYSLSSKID